MINQGKRGLTLKAHEVSECMELPEAQRNEYLANLRDLRKARKKPATASVKRGVVYVIKSEIGLYKIGFTNDVKRRLDTFKTACPLEIELLFEIPSDDERALEAMLHEKFKENRRRGEWFALSEPDIMYLCQLAS